MAIKFLSTVQVDTDVLYADASSNNVGIGTTSPAKKLTIGGIGINNTDGLKIEDPSNTAYGAHYSYDDASSTVEIGGVTNNVLNDCISIARDATRAITINTSENVGIGTTSPSSRLDVLTNSSSPVAILKNTSGTGGSGLDVYGGTGSGSNILTLYDKDSNQRLEVTGEGNVGIGTTSPSARLEVQGTNSNTQAALKVTDSGDSFFEVVPDNNTTFKIGDLDAVGDEAMIVGTFSDITFSKGGTTTMILDSNNRVGIGTTTPSEKLEVNGSVKATASTDAYKGYIKQTITSSANEKVDNADYNLVPYNTLTTVNSDQSYNRMVAAYDGRIKKVYIRNTSGTPTADTVNFKKQINNTTAATVYSATVANAASAGMSAVYNFADSDFTFNEGDTFGILYQTTNSGGVARAMAGVAINVIVEYNIT